MTTGEPRPAAGTDLGPTMIGVRGVDVNNLSGLDVDVPLHRLVGIAGASGSGKSSLAMGVLYAEGSRRYLGTLSTYTRRRMAQAPRAADDSVEHVPAAPALRQRPGVPGIRSTVATYGGIMDDSPRVHARVPAAAEHGLTAGDFFCNTCPDCGGSITGRYLARHLAHQPSDRASDRGSDRGKA